jgi:hypothetical protein
MLYTVRIRLSGVGLAARMSEMREWLDRHRYEPDLFQYRNRMDADGALLRVDFKVESEAFAFAEAFNGSVLR